MAADGKMMALAVKPSAAGLELWLAAVLVRSHLVASPSRTRFTYDVVRNETANSMPVTVFIDWPNRVTK